MSLLHFVFKAGTVVGVRRGGERITLERDTTVQVNIDDGEVYSLARQAAKNKSRRATSGPATAKVIRS